MSQKATSVIYLPFPRLVMSVVRVGCSVGQFRAQMGIMNDGIKMFHRENQHIQFEMTCRIERSSSSSSSSN